MDAHGRKGRMWTCLSSSSGAGRKILVSFAIRHVVDVDVDAEVKYRMGREQSICVSTSCQYGTGRPKELHASGVPCSRRIAALRMDKGQAQEDASTGWRTNRECVNGTTTLFAQAEVRSHNPGHCPRFLFLEYELGQKTPLHKSMSCSWERSRVVDG